MAKAQYAFLAYLNYLDKPLSNIMRKKTNTSGGSAGAGGLNFQAAIGTIAYVHTLRGTPVQWVDGLALGIPVSVSFETDGPGDDISVELADGNIIEVQVKKGLRATKAFWTIIDSLSEGISSRRCDFGILIVCPSSSNTVRSDFAKAIRRVGDKRHDDQSGQQIELTAHLKKRGYDPAKICKRIRIKTVSALSDQGDAIAAARAELGHVCANKSYVKPAWSVLYEEALRTIELKGQRTNPSLVSVLRSSDIAIKNDDNDTSPAIRETLLKWIDETTEHFTVLGIPELLATDSAWLQLNASVGDNTLPGASSVEDALQAYHAMGERSVEKYRNGIDAKTIGTFRKRCVIIGGPGCGKSLLMKVLARELGRDGLISLRVRLRDLARRIESTGCTVEEGLLSLGLANSGITPDQLRVASLSELVFLCDGLDECGDSQPVIASGMKDISVSSPSYRIIVTTRTIGYNTSELKHWRHYQIMPLDPENVTDDLEALCRCALGTGSAIDNNLRGDIATYVNASRASTLISKSPLLLAFAAALFLKRKTLGDSKTELYAQIFKLIDDGTIRRKENASATSKAVRDRMLDHLGWFVSTSPLLAAEEIEKQCAKAMARDLGESYLKSLSLAQEAITYWEDAGLIERLRHTKQDLISFVHKSCGEFGAARYLASIDASDAKMLIEEEIENSEWQELLDFLTQTPTANVIADVVIERAISSELSLRLVQRALHIIARPEIYLSPSRLALLLERIFLLARSEDRGIAYRVGAFIANSNMSHVLEVAEQSERLLRATYEWSRLIGWTILVCHFPDRLDRTELEKTVLYYAARSRDESFFIRTRDSFFGAQRDTEVFEHFLINAFELLMKNETVKYQDKLIGVLNELEAVQTLGGMIRIEKVLRGIGREDALAMFSSLQEMLRFNAIDTSRYRAGYRRLFRDVVAGAFIAEATLGPPRTGLKHLAAFLQLTQIMEVPLRDIKAWGGDSELLYVHELIRAAAYVFGLSPVRLASESKALRDEINAGADDGRVFGFLQMVPSVDTAEINWERAKQIELDNVVLERLAHHPSLWLKRIAICVLDSRLIAAERFEV